MFQAPTRPPLRGKLSSEEIRDLFSQVANEFALMPATRGGGDRGFEGGIFNAPTINNPTIMRGTLGSNTQVVNVVCGYTVFAKSTFTTMGTGNVGFVRNADGKLRLLDGPTTKFFTDDAHNVVLGTGTADLALNAGGGYPYLPTTSGVATGAPAVYAGMVAVIVDRVAKKIGLRIDGAWVWSAAFA